MKGEAGGTLRIKGHQTGPSRQPTFGRPQYGSRNSGRLKLALDNVELVGNHKVIGRGDASCVNCGKKKAGQIGQEKETH